MSVQSRSKVIDSKQANHYWLPQTNWKLNHVISTLYYENQYNRLPCFNHFGSDYGLIYLIILVISLYLIEHRTRKLDLHSNWNLLGTRTHILLNVWDAGGTIRPHILNSYFMAKFFHFGASKGFNFENPTEYHYEGVENGWLLIMLPWKLFVLQDFVSKKSNLYIVLICWRVELIECRAPDFKGMGSIKGFEFGRRSFEIETICRETSFYGRWKGICEVTSKKFDFKEIWRRRETQRKYFHQNNYNLVTFNSKTVDNFNGWIATRVIATR